MEYNFNIKTRYHHFLLKSNRRFMLLYGFALIATYPLLVFFCKDLSNVYTLKMIGQILNILIAASGSIFIPLLMYRYTTLKKSIDVYDALPMQKESMFAIHYFTGLTMLLFPLLISFSLGFIYAVFNPNPEVLLSSSYFMEPKLAFEAIHFLELSVALILSYTITVFVKQNCGTTIDALIYTAVVHLTPILTYLAIYSYCSAVLLGFSEPFSTDLFLYLTPFPMMFHFFSNTNGIVSIPRFIFFIVMIAVLYIAASYLYVYHKGERSEAPFMNSYFFPIVSYIITIVAVILLYSSMQFSFMAIINDVNQFIYPILLGLIFYLVLDVIAHRGFTHILKAAMHFLFIAIIVLGLLLPIDYTKGFGYVTHVPNINNIESITVNFPYQIQKLLEADSEITFTTPEDIETLVKFHELILKEYESYEYSDNLLRNSIMNNEVITNTYPFDIGKDISYRATFEYDLKIGNMKRSYSLPLSWTYDLLSLYNSEAIVNARFTSSDDKFTLAKDMYLLNAGMQNSIKLNGVDQATLFSLLKEDMLACSKEEFYQSPQAPYGILELVYQNPNNHHYGRNEYITIRSAYKKTIAYLNSITEAPSFTMPSENAMITLAYPHDSASFHTINEGYSYIYTNYDDLIKYKHITPEILSALIPYLQPTAMFDEAGFVVTIEDDDYKMYLVSSQLAPLIEDLTKSIEIEKANQYEIIK